MRLLLRRATVTAIALVTALVIASPAQAAPDKAAGTLTIEHVGSSPILSWSWGISNPVTIGSGSGGAGTGKVTFSSFNLQKRINALSTDLMQAVASGSHFGEAVISVPMGGPGVPFEIEYRLHPVFVESLQQSGGNDDASESVSLAFGAIEQTIGNTSHFGWAPEG